MLVRDVNIKDYFCYLEIETLVVYSYLNQLKPLKDLSSVLRLVYRCTQWIKLSFFYSFSFLRLFLLETKATLTHMGQSYQYPTNFSLLEYREIFFVYISTEIPEFTPTNSCKKWMCLNFFNSIDSKSIFWISHQLSKINHYPYLIKSAAWGLTSASFGITKYFLQFWILCHVSEASSDAKGG